MKEKEIYKVINCKDDKTVENVYEGVYTECLTYCLNKLDQYKNQKFDLKIVKKETEYIVKYGPIVNNGYSKQDLEMMIFISDLTKEEVSETIKNNVDKANADKSWYNGIYLSVQTVDEFLASIPTYKL